jgi:hypothetical protein
MYNLWGLSLKIILIPKTYKISIKDIGYERANSSEEVKGVTS